MLTQSYFFSAGLSDRISSTGRGVENASCKKKNPPASHVRIPSSIIVQYGECTNKEFIHMENTVVCSSTDLQCWLACNSVLHHSWWSRKGPFNSGLNNERMRQRPTAGFIPHFAMQDQECHLHMHALDLPLWFANRKRKVSNQNLDFHFSFKNNNSFTTVMWKTCKA